MTDSAWMAWAKQHYNTDEAGVRKLMSDRLKAGREKYQQEVRDGKRKHVTPFSDPEVARKAGAKGKSVRFGKEYNNTDAD